MMLLDSHVIEDPDFAETRRTALSDASDVACAEAMQPTNRYWWRLVGRRYDVLSWGPDKHIRKFPDKLRAGES